MKVSDYIVEYLIEKGITDVFGYPGGMITHLMESFSKYHRSCFCCMWLCTGKGQTRCGVCYIWSRCNKFNYWSM